MNAVDVAILLIRLGVGFCMVCFGLSQFFRPNGWLGYIPKWLGIIMPMKPATFMREHALGNFFLGLIFMLGLWPVVTAWIVAGWWLSILPFAFLYDCYIALRDLAIIMCVVAVIVLHRT